MQEYYKILGLSQGASEEEVDNAYNTLKEKYSKERFEEGEVGNNAARELTKLETAYQEIKDSLRKQDFETHNQSSYADVEQLIKENKISVAQEKLDNYTDRNAEWHYLQSVIFYKKNWINESKKQLEIALTMEPHNVKYSDSYTKLKQKIDFNEKQFSNNGANNQGTNPANDPNRQMGGMDTNSCMSCCSTWCCMDMLCNMCCR